MRCTSTIVLLFYNLACALVTSFDWVPLLPFKDRNNSFEVTAHDVLCSEIDRCPPWNHPLWPIMSFLSLHRPRDHPHLRRFPFFNPLLIIACALSKNKRDKRKEDPCRRGHAYMTSNRRSIPQHHDVIFATISVSTRVCIYPEIETFETGSSVRRGTDRSRPLCDNMRLLAIALVVYCFGLVAGHVPFFEPELYGNSTSPEDDWSLQDPFVIPLDAKQGWSPSLNNSRAITSLLALNPDDLYDAAMFDIPKGDSDQYVIGLEALAPDCPDYRSFYPSLALLGPSTNPDFPEVNETMRAMLPFEIPDGYGAIIREPPRIQRDTYSASPFQSYLLSPYLTKECIETQEGFSNCSDGKAAKSSIITDLMVPPGRYYIVWWNPDYTEVTDGPSVPRQVTVSLGVAEDPTPREQKVQMQLMTGQDIPSFFACLGTFVNIQGSPPGNE